ncbi:hypothetical protein AAE478_001415 [Parahypoxylon ruwenzoriense]
MAPPEQPATTVRGRPNPSSQAQVEAEAGGGSGAGGAAEKSPPFEFRGFDFFANRDFNELKNASRAYFAPATTEKHQRLPSTWLGDATPPSTPRPSGNGFLHPLPVQMPPSVGVGVGVSKEAWRSAEATAATAAAAAVSSSSPAVVSSGSGVPSLTSMSITSTSSPSATMTSSRPVSSNAAEGKIDCPAANGTIYPVPGSDKRFLRICGIDYVGEEEALDLRQVPTESILDCMKNCAGTTGCTGCGWGVLEGDMGSQHTCWLKGNLKSPHEADVNWAFAVLL